MSILTKMQNGGANAIPAVFSHGQSLIGMRAFTAGFTWGCSTFRWVSDDNYRACEPDEGRYAGKVRSVLTGWQQNHFAFQPPLRKQSLPPQNYRDASSEVCPALSQAISQ